MKPQAIGSANVILKGNDMKKSAMSEKGQAQEQVSSLLGTHQTGSPVILAQCLQHDQTPQTC